MRDPTRREILRRRALVIELFLGMVLLLLSLNNSELFREIAAAGGGGIASAALMITPLGHFFVAKFDNFCHIFFTTLFTRR